MPQSKPNGPMRIRLEDERREAVITAMTSFFAEEFDEEITRFRAEETLRFFVNTLGSAIYNQAFKTPKRLCRPGWPTSTLSSTRLSIGRGSSRSLLFRPVRWTWGPTVVPGLLIKSLPDEFLSFRDGGEGVEQIDKFLLYKDIFRVCCDSPACTAFVTWGVDDGHSWIPGFTGNPDEPLLFDADYQPKPAYHALFDA